MELYNNIIIIIFHPLNSNALNLVSTFVIEKYVARSSGSAVHSAKDTYFSGRLFHSQMAGYYLKRMEKQTAHSIVKPDFGSLCKQVDTPRSCCMQIQNLTALS